MKVWAGRLKTDIISTFNAFLRNRDEKHILWLDNCSAQNKNCSLMSFFVYIANSDEFSLEKLEVKIQKKVCEVKEKNSYTPNKNVRELLNGQKVTPEVKRKLITGEVLQLQLKKNFKYQETIMDKLRFVNSISGDIGYSARNWPGTSN